jgi:hypothetical protein
MDRVQKKPNSSGLLTLLTELAINYIAVMFERFKHKWKDNVKLDPKETACEYVDWIQLA